LSDVPRGTFELRRCDRTHERRARRSLFATCYSVRKPPAGAATRIVHKTWHSSTEYGQQPRLSTCEFTLTVAGSQVVWQRSFARPPHLLTENPSPLLRRHARHPCIRPPRPAHAVFPASSALCSPTPPPSAVAPLSCTGDGRRGARARHRRLHRSSWKELHRQVQALEA
jgi:hypothetical protein